MKKSFIQKINSTNPALGTLVTLASPEIAEILSLSGFDWLFIDTEHGAISISETQHITQAIKGDCAAIVRIPGNNPVWIKKALDTGCDGIIVPLVNTAEDAKKAVDAAKYPPLGARSVGIARAQDYGLSFNEYVKTANDTTALIIQIEHIEAVDNIDAILSVKGIDGVLIGPYDLSGSLNMLGDVTSKPVQDAIQKIKQACKKRSIPFGIFVMKPESAQSEINDGAQFIAVGIDTILLSTAAKDVLRKCKESL